MYFAACKVQILNQNKDTLTYLGINVTSLCLIDGVLGHENS